MAIRVQQADSCSLGHGAHQPKPGFVDPGVNNTEAAVDSRRENEVTGGEVGGGVLSFSVWAF